MWWCTATGALRITGTGTEPTRSARRVGLGADQRAQFHHRLVEVACPLVGDQLLGQLPERVACFGRIDGLLDEEQACQYTGDVAVEDRGGPAVGDRGDGPGGVAPDPREFQQCLGRGGHLSAVFLLDGLRRRVQVPRPAVVAQSLPQPQHGLLVRRREVIHRGQRLDEAVEVGDHRSDLRLLEHRLADQHVVGVRRLARFGPPGKAAVVRVVPLQQAFAQLTGARLGVWRVRV
jgi:hypothetical protein